MLTNLSINNYTLVEHLDLEIKSGMTAITGETGAGKSVLLGALGLTLGDRADPERVRAGAERADVYASFDLRHLKSAQAWLKEQALFEDSQECILRRMITAEGRSRAFVNGQPVTINQLRELGEMLIDIHAQHEHQSLLQKDTPRRLLDEYAGHTTLAEEVAQAFREWQTTQNRYQHLKENLEENTAQVQLLSYQVEELDQLDLREGELVELEAEQTRLANGESILHSSYQITALCGAEDQSILEGINRALHLLHDLPQEIKAISEASQLLASAQIQVEEAMHEMERHIDSFELDPERLKVVEERLSAVFDIARKHRVAPQDLVELHQRLCTELQALSGADADLDQLESRVKQLYDHYTTLATQLTSKRTTAAEKLSKAVNKQLVKLAMDHAVLKVDVAAIDAPSLHGQEDIHLLISTNPGQPLKPLNKVASGGELSRVSLAIQVVTAQTSSTPTLIFDEVDVGIGGATADMVGQLLRQLGEKTQIICVTHLAQVAGKAHSHVRVQKIKKGAKVETQLEQLNEEQKVEEIARMIGNDKITESSLQHAREMIS